MIEIPVSIGEVFDKITILQIKQSELKDPEKLENVSRELALLETKVQGIPVNPALLERLKQINKQLWHIEDELRLCEKHQEFGKNFISLARLVYITNDKRAELKRQINQETGSQLMEEKSYETYCMHS